MLRAPGNWSLAVATAVLCGCGILATTSQAHAAKAPYVRGAARNGLFYNYYVPSPTGGPPASLYISPRPTPPWVGHTYITYEPLMPHEFLYRHHKVYRRYDGGPIPANVTHVRWWRMPEPFHWLH